MNKVTYTYTVEIKERGKRDPEYFTSSDFDEALRVAEYYRLQNRRDHGKYSVTMTEKKDKNMKI